MSQAMTTGLLPASVPPRGLWPHVVNWGLLALCVGAAGGTSLVLGRIPALYGVALTAGAAWLLQTFGRRRGDAGPTVRRDPALVPTWWLLAMSWLVSFLLWTAQYSILRDLVALELLTGVLLIGRLRWLVRPVAAGAATIMRRSGNTSDRSRRSRIRLAWA